MAIIVKDSAEYANFSVYSKLFLILLYKYCISLSKIYSSYFMIYSQLLPNISTVYF